VIGVTPNPNWLMFTLLFGVPGQFPVELTQFSLMLITYYFTYLIFIKGGQMLAGFPCIQCYGRRQCHTLFDQTASDRWATHKKTGGAVLLARILSLVRYHQPLGKGGRKITKHRETKDK
jgi:hypothetical protein